MIVALRALRRTRSLGCSIDPTPEGLSALTAWLRRNSSPAPLAVVRRRYGQMARILGPQDVRVWGVPPDTHFAHALVEADYLMKLIAMGLEPSRVRGLRSYLAMMTPQGNSQQRFWFTPLYDAFYRTEDGLADALEGQRAQLLAQEELVGPDGRRQPSPFTRHSTQAFARQFTERFPELVRKHPPFASLQNLFDLAVIAALITREELDERVGWTPTLFLDEDRLNVARGPVPRRSPTLVNIRQVNRGTVIGLLCGGVEIAPPALVQPAAFRTDGKAKTLPDVRSAADPARIPKTAWWWD
ncbi:MAG: DUF1598 domain-containing protein [Planctomycetota bacterium]|nr:MAG: DUF1598 domain-containing protein [Planctomycetota bacterium]